MKTEEDIFAVKYDSEEEHVIRDAHRNWLHSHPTMLGHSIIGPKGCVCPATFNMGYEYFKKHWLENIRLGVQNLAVHLYKRLRYISKEELLERVALTLTDESQSMTVKEFTEILRNL